MRITTMLTYYLLKNQENFPSVELESRKRREINFCNAIIAIRIYLQVLKQLNDEKIFKENYKFDKNRLCNTFIVIYSIIN